MEVNRRNMEKFVAALRSGEYRQGMGELCTPSYPEQDGPEHCCLGVACDVSGLGKWAPSGVYVIGRSKFSSYLPDQVADWLGIGTTNPELEFPDPDTDAVHILKATDANDSWEYSFEEIADAFERKYLS